MSTFSVLNNISALSAENQLSITQKNLSMTLGQLSSGSRINSGADDPAGLSIVNGLNASISALNQSSQNANDGIGLLQVADGALSQVSTLLNTAVTLATEAANGGLSASQQTALDNEYSTIKTEITNIGANTTFNGTSVFSASTTSIFLSDANSSYDITVTVGALSAGNIQGGAGSSLTAVNLSTTDLTTAAKAATALTSINNAITNVASTEGSVGATVNQLQAATNVISTQVQNLTSAENSIDAANIPEEVTNMSNYQILEQTGMSALAQANSDQQAVLKLFQ